MKMGRPKDPIWDKFDRELNGGIAWAKCKLCTWKQAGNPCRMTAHYSTTHSHSKKTPVKKKGKSSNNGCGGTNTSKIIKDSSPDGDLRFEERMSDLEDKMSTFREEINLKMTIMEQILTTRDEQLVVQKKLIEREHALYQSVLVHWKNAAELVGNGLSLKFSKRGQDVLDVVPDYEGVEAQGQGLISPTKRSTSSARRGRRKKRLRVDPKPNRDDHSDAEQGSDHLPSGENEVQECGVVTEMNDEVGRVMERKVFIDYYEGEGDDGLDGQGSKNTIWKHYLREENGNSAMCKHCDEKGLQKIIKLDKGELKLLRRHLKFAHKERIHEGELDEEVQLQQSFVQGEMPDSNVPKVHVPIQNNTPAADDVEPDNAEKDVWDYFTRDADGQSASCDKCRCKVKTVGGNTFSLFGHLRNVHTITIRKRQRKLHHKIMNKSKVLY